MITISNLSKSFGTQTLFEQTTFQLSSGERYGLVGANGSGKSTLLKIFAKLETPDEGSITMSGGTQIGHLRQDQYVNDSVSILKCAMQGQKLVYDAMEKKEELLESNDPLAAAQVADLEETIAHNDGYTLEARTAEILEGLGISTNSHQMPLSTLSGGFRLRVLLAKVLVSSPDILLLDEPTNHLDILSIRWLEKFIVQQKQSVVVIVSHDIRFLDNICTHILDIDYGFIKKTRFSKIVLYFSLLFLHS